MRFTYDGMTFERRDGVWGQIVNGRWQRVQAVLVPIIGWSSYAIRAEAKRLGVPNNENLGHTELVEILVEAYA